MGSSRGIAKGYVLFQYVEEPGALR